MGSPFKRVRVHKDGKKVSYWYIVYKKNGKRKWEAVGEVGKITKAVASELLKKREQEAKLEVWDMYDVKIPALEEFSIDYIDYQRDIKRKRSWKKDGEHLRRWNAVFGKRKLSQITAKDIDEYKRQRLTEVKPSTVNRELEVLRHLFYLAKRWKKFFGENPVSESGLLQVNNQIERILTLEEETTLLACSADHLKPIITIALNSAMRKGEILSLTWKDIDLENNLITVKQEVSKSKRTRKIPISSNLRKFLFKQKLLTGRGNYVFLTPEGNPYSPNNPNALKRAFGMACKRANIKGLRFHDLRHTSATRMVESGANIVAISRILGHGDLKTTMRYAHPEDSLKDAVEKLGNYSRGVSQSVSQQKIN